MKKLFTPFIFIAAFFNAQVTSFPWTETFEDASPTIGQWTQVQETGSKSWTIESSYYAYTPTTPYAGSKMAQFTCSSFSGDTTKYISPVLNLSGSTGATLEFKFRNRVWDTDQNILKAYYRTSSTGTWTLLQTYNTNVLTWTSSGVLNLPNTSATYQIALEGIAMYGYHINVDEVVVTSQNLATSEVDTQKNSFKIYPNPTSDFINISSEKRISEISIFDLTGKQMRHIKVDNTEAKIPVHQLPSGTYIIQMKNTEGILNSQKFIKK